MKRIKSLRLVLVATLLLWSIGPAVAYATDEVQTAGHMVEYHIDVSPDSATNKVGQEHEFIVELTINDGVDDNSTDGLTAPWDYVAGEDIRVDISAPGHFVSIDGTAVSGQTWLGTDADGRLSIIVNSDTAGTSTLSAWVDDGYIGSGAGAVEFRPYPYPSGEKIWEDYKALGAISGAVWHDLNANGIIDGDEARLSGWTVTLYAADGATPLATKLSGADGSYGFGDLLPGTYWLAETLGSPEWSNTTPVKRMFEVIYDVEMDEIYVTPIDVNFGNEKPFLGFHADTALLPYTGGLYHPTLPVLTGPGYMQTSNPLRQTSNGLLGALVMAALAITAVMASSAGARKVFL